MEAWRARLKRVLTEFEELDDAECSEMLVLHALRGAEGVITHPVKKQRGGSVPGRAANVDRDREAGHARLIADYFAPNPVYNSRLFRRRFRLPPAMFDIVLEGVLEADDYFVQKKDALGVPGLSPYQKVTAALRMCCYGVAADSTDEYLRLAESTAMKSFKRFALAVVTHFGAEYLRDPTEEDIHRHAELNARRGFPGMFGSLDCTHWVWKNCPVGWQGMYQDRDGNSSVIMEAVATKDLWIWHHSLGIPGSNNDINVLDRSPLIVNWLGGHAPNYEFTLNGHDFKMCYLLTDGIYPNWSVFVKTISDPVGKKEKNFAAMQEAARKDVERCFGVLKSRFGILSQPGRLWDEAMMRTVWKACVILHNMVVEYGRDDECDYLEDVQVRLSARENLTFDSLLMEMTSLQNPQNHSVLQENLVEELWHFKMANS
ncbi:hypothetical protein PF010_g26926 [Phytophthora fragariae]|nr:hypothetical protein PF003_g32372 [Phytophthora fragariae]KAE8921603.1 hypothetical protein PF009_g28122 [Phytophthora fragariae]KAE9068778.1 hypothetical protein PF010_g26926 [Phytophthora fragariae]